MLWRASRPKASLIVCSGRAVTTVLPLVASRLAMFMAPLHARGEVGLRPPRSEIALILAAFTASGKARRPPHDFGRLPERRVARPQRQPAIPYAPASCRGTREGGTHGQKRAPLVRGEWMSPQRLAALAATKTTAAKSK